MSYFTLSVAAGRPWHYIEKHFEATRSEVLAAQPYTLWANWGEVYSDRLWTRSRGLGSDPASPTDAEMFPRVEFWQNTHPVGGGRRAYISGVTRNSAGAVLGGVTVHLYRTSDDAEMDEVTSDATDGTYSAGGTPDVNHYLTAYKAGAPDVAGTSVNTLTGS